MVKKIVVEFVKYYCVSVRLPEGYSDNIDDWTEDQQEKIAELAHDKMYESTRDSEWLINEETDNNGFVEIVDE